MNREKGLKREIQILETRIKQLEEKIPHMEESIMLSVINFQKVWEALKKHDKKHEEVTWLN